MSDFEKRISELSPEKRELLDLFLGESDGGGVWLQGDYTAPRTSREESLADCWREVLGRQRVGIHDNFFEIGGDSLHCIQIVSRCREAGLQLTVNDLFKHPTVAELAAIADAASAGGSVSLELEPEPGL
ncbi:MAG TPA: phosphopantetheine-binding protein, partial [Blastocatellia bacterium]|nr:phosphopantetheine-binding protein [Blastocatellia bacterium]